MQPASFFVASTNSAITASALALSSTVKHGWITQSEYGPSLPPDELEKLSKPECVG